MLPSRNIWTLHMIQQICPYKDTCKHHTSLARQAQRKKGATVYLVTSGATKVEIRLCFLIYFPPRFVTYPFLVSFVSKTKLLTLLNGTFWIKIRCCKRCCLNKFEAIHCIKLLWKKLIFWLQTLGWNVFCRCNVFMNIWWNSFV